MEPDAGVIVVGLGAMGSQTLWRLARRGVRVIGVEQFVPGHSRGSSHGESRMIRSAYAEGAAYVPLVTRAWELWRELERVSGRSLAHRDGALMIGPPDGSLVGGAAAAAQAHGLAYEILSAEGMRRRFPQHQITGDLVGLHEKAAGLIRPEAGIVAAVEVAVSLGAQVRTDVPVTEIVPDPERPSVRLGAERLTARHVVVSPGAWLPQLIPGLFDHLRPVRRVMGWFRMRDADAFTHGRFPVFVRDDNGMLSYGFPTMDGRTVKASLHHGPGLDEPVDPGVGPRPPDQADAARLAEVFAKTLPGLHPEPVRMEGCIYTMTPDEHFIVGPHPDLPGVTLLGGFSGHGFKFAPVLGEAAADLALEGHTDLPIGLFDPHRF